MGGMVASAALALGSGGIPLGGFAAASGIVSAVGAIGSAVSIASAVGGLFGSRQGIKAETQANVAAANYNSQVADYNAQVASNNATQAIAASNVQAQQIREDNVRRISTIRNKFAKGGVVTTEGSSLLVALDQASEGEFAAQNELYAGRLQASGYEAEANLQRSRSGYNQYQAQNARTVGSIKAGTSLLTGASSIYKAVS